MIAVQPPLRNSTNNNPNTVFTLFMEAVEKIGWKIKRFCRKRFSIDAVIFYYVLWYLDEKSLSEHF